MTASLTPAAGRPIARNTFPCQVSRTPFEAAVFRRAPTQRRSRKTAARDFTDYPIWKTRLSKAKHAISVERNNKRG